MSVLPTHPRRRALAFTLIELLVVVGIIAVLLGILMPIITRVHEQARCARCMNNMRHIYHATLAYVTDNDAALFYAPMIGDTTLNAPYCFIMQSLGIIDYQQGVMWKYLGDTPTARQALFNCPSDFQEHPNNNPDVVRNFSYSFNAGLTWNGGYDLSNPPAGPQLHFTAIPSPSHKILIWEEVGPNDGACWCLGGDRDDYPTQRHSIWGKRVSDNGSDTSIHGNGFGNQCFADGHVESLEPQNIWSNSYFGDLRVER